MEIQGIGRLILTIEDLQKLREFIEDKEPNNHEKIKKINLELSRLNQELRNIKKQFVSHRDITPSLYNSVIFQKYIQGFYEIKGPYYVDSIKPLDSPTLQITRFCRHFYTYREQPNYDFLKRELIFLKEIYEKRKPKGIVEYHEKELKEESFNDFKEWRKASINIKAPQKNNYIFEMLQTEKDLQFDRKIEIPKRGLYDLNSQITENDPSGIPNQFNQISQNCLNLDPQYEYFKYILEYGNQLDILGELEKLRKKEKE